jgi:hypothetical protein
MLVPRSPGTSVRVRPLVGKHTEAEEVLKAAVARFPQHAPAAIEFSRIPHRKRDWPEALARWNSALIRFPDNSEVYAGAASVLRAMGRLNEWEALISDAVVKFSDEPRFAIDHAEAAHLRKDWPEATRRWSEARNKYPNNQEIQEGLGRTHFRARLDQFDRSGADEALTKVAPETNDLELKPTELMMRFESLGSGCEFGLVQRYFGAEPLGLLRWGAIPPLSLANALRENFDQVGNPDHVELFELGDSREFFFRDKRHSLEMHTFIPVEGANYEQVFTQQCRRAMFLKRKILEDLSEGYKIFVYKRHAGSLSDDEAYPIYDALRQYGDNMLLCLLPENGENSHGTMKIRETGLIYGYIDKLSDASSASEIKYLSWLQILTAAFRLRHQVI